MIIGGLEKFSLSDYPGTPCAVIFCQGCNFRCPFCHNGELLPLEGENLISQNELFTFLAKRKGTLQGVVVSGGEPTVQNDLAGFISTIKSMGYQVKLDTNGSNPTVIADLLNKQLLDFIAMDIKAPEDKYDNLSGVTTDMDAIAESIKLISQSDIPHLFRTTWVKSLLNKQDITAIRKWLPSTANYIPQVFNPETALVAGMI